MHLIKTEEEVRFKVSLPSVNLCTDVWTTVMDSCSTEKNLFQSVLWHICYSLLMHLYTEVYIWQHQNSVIDLTE